MNENSRQLIDEIRGEANGALAMGHDADARMLHRAVDRLEALENAMQEIADYAQDKLSARYGMNESVIYMLHTMRDIAAIVERANPTSSPNPPRST